MKKETFKITGTSHYEENIRQLQIPNDDYGISKHEILEIYGEDERVYENDYDIGKVELVPEPDNPYDSNAVVVLIDGLKVGYVKKGSCSHVKNLLADPNFDHFETEIGGGKYKIVYMDDDDKYQTDTGESPFWVHITIYTREPEDDRVKKLEERQAEFQKQVIAQREAAVPDPVEAAPVKKKGRPFFMVCGIILIAMSALLTLVGVLSGLFGIALGIFSIWYSKR